MVITTAVNEDDYLQHQLYTASRSQQVTSQRQRNKVLISAVYLLLAGLRYAADDVPGTIFFMVFAVLWFVLYPIWQRRHYVKYYRRFVQEHFNGRIGRVAEIEIHDEYISERDEGAEVKIFTKEIVEIVEIRTVILIRLKTGVSLILAKDKIDVVPVRKRLEDLARYLNISYVRDEHWAWK